VNGAGEIYVQLPPENCLMQFDIGARRRSVFADQIGGADAREPRRRYSYAWAAAVMLWCSDRKEPALNRVRNKQSRNGSAS